MKDGRSENVQKAEAYTLGSTVGIATDVWPGRSGLRSTAGENYLFFSETPTGHVMHQHFNIQQLYALPTLYLCVLYLSENKQRLVSLTA